MATTEAWAADRSRGPGAWLGDRPVGAKITIAPAFTLLAGAVVTTLVGRFRV